MDFLRDIFKETARVMRPSGKIRFLKEEFKKIAYEVKDAARQQANIMRNNRF